MAILALVWAYRIETNTAKTAELLARIEKQLAANPAKERK